MPEKTTKVQAPKTVKYVAIFDCTYKNRWTRRGTVIELPADVQFTHKCFEKLGPESHVNSDMAEMYDKSAEEIKARRVNSVMSGVYRREN